MTRSLEALLSGVIDYAGLFPPARLDMRHALADYVRYSRGPEAWIMTRFVCTASRLDELRQEIESQQPADPVPVAVIGTMSSDANGWEDALQSDAESMTDFSEQAAEAAEIEAYEIRVPDHEKIKRYVGDLKGFDEAEIYVELPWSDEIPASLTVIADAGYSAKFRTGGISASAFPSVEQVAGVLHDALSTEVAFKLTAGLHHPFPTIDPETGGSTQGFVNVLVAAALIYSEDLSRTQASAILQDNPESFKFDADGLSWNGFRAGLEAIAEMRHEFIGFGSCSIDEPLGDLRSVGLL
jgi:hypothetical protein